MLAAVALATPVTLALQTSAPVSAQTPPVPKIWPTPQSVQDRGDIVPVTPAVAVVTGPGSDPSAVTVVRQVLTAAGARTIRMVPDSAPPPDVGLTVYVGGPAENSASVPALHRIGIDQDAADLPAEGYVLGIGKDSETGHGVAVLDGVDPTGTFYAAQSLRQLVEPRTGRDVLPAARVRDWPDSRLRGVIEGFYGPPWSHEDRISQLQFFGRTKQNIYVYSPKDDPYLRARWRDPYPADQLAQIQDLVDAAKANHVEFTYALSPGLSVCYSSDADEQALVDKFQSLWDVGVRSFAVPLDDISYTSWNCPQDQDRFGSGGGAAGQAQAYLLNRVQQDFIATHPGAQRLQMVPTEYADVADSPYKTALRTHLDPQIIVEWTGVGVVPATITTEQAAQARQVYGHDVLVWDNYPVNDYETRRLFLGPYNGRDPGITDSVVGVTANPMIEAEPSKIAEFTSADFLWNPGSYDPQTAWHAAMRYLGGDAASALTVFAENNYSSILNATESPTLTPLIARFWQSLGQPGFDDAAQPLADYFDALAQARDRLAAQMGDPAFVDEARPWLDKAHLYGVAGAAGVRSLVAEEHGDFTTAWHDRVTLDSTAEQARQIYQVVAPGVIEPFLQRAQDESHLVSVTSPSDGASFQPGDDIRLAATVHSGNVPISHVDFYAGPQKVGTDATAPYGLTWSDVPTGYYEITATAVAGDGSQVASAPARVTVGQPAPALLVVGSDSPLSIGDAAVRDRLEYLGHPVVVERASAAQPADADGKSLVAISSTVSSGDVNTKFRDTTTPVVVWESFDFDDLGMATNPGETWDVTSIHIDDPTSPVAAGLSGTIPVYRGPDRLRWGTPGPGATDVASMPDDPQLATLFTYDTGAPMLGLDAPGRRVGIFLSDNGVDPDAVNANGLALFDAAVEWATSG